MDVNEDERLIKFDTKTQIKVEEQHFYCCSTFHSHSNIFNNGCHGQIVWQLDLQLPMQSVPIAIDVVSSNLDQGEMYNIM